MAERGQAGAVADPIEGSPVYPGGSRVNERGHLEIGYGDARLGSKYRGQRDPTASLYHRDFDRGRVRR